MSLLRLGGSSPPTRLVLDKGRNSQLLAKFKGFIRKEKLFAKGASILIAVSGGPDSICLLHLLFLLSDSYQLKIAVAHFDHCLRGQESRRDKDFVEMVCKVNSITFFSEKGDVLTVAHKNARGIQETARQLRYAFLRKTAIEHGFEYTATGHTCDDQAEEIIFRLVRGAGPQGLSGIKLKREDNVIRPLLFCTKREILEHLNRYEIGFVEDSSNLQTKYTRNKIRHLLMPIIEKEFNPTAANAIYRSARLLAEECRALNSIAETAYPRCRAKGVEIPGLFLNRDILLEWPRAIRKRIYKKALAELGMDYELIRYDHLEKIDEINLSDSGSSLYNLPKGYVVIKSYDLVCFLKEFSFLKMGKTMDTEHFSLTIDRPGRFKLKGVGTVIVEPAGCSEVSIPCKHFLPRPLFLDLDTISFPLKITFRKSGDRFQPLGLDKEVKLKKFLINRRIPRFIRDFLPILRIGDKIVAICGVEISQLVKIGTDTNNCLKISWQPEDWLTMLRCLKNLH